KRISIAVSTKISLRKIGCVMNVSPLQSGYATCGPDDQGQHLGRQAGVSRLICSWPRYWLIAQTLRLDECLRAGDPIDGFARLFESLCFGETLPIPLRPECEHGRATLARGRSLPAVRRAYAWLWLPTH